MSDLDPLFTDLFAEARALEMDDDDVRRVIGRLPVRRRRRTLVWVAAIVPALGILGGAGYLATRSETSSLVAAGVGCASNVGGYGEVDSIASVAEDGRGPIAICAELWRTAAIDRTTRDVPPLTACAGTQEAAGLIVYPTADPGVCERYGRAPLPDDYLSVYRRMTPLLALASSTIHFESPGCRRVAELEVEATSILTRSRLTGWTVNVHGKSGACGQIGLDPAARTVGVYAFEPTPDRRPLEERLQEKAWLNTMAAIKDEVPGGIEGERCLDPSAAIRIVRRQMEQPGLKRVRLAIYGVGPNGRQAFTDRLPCATVTMEVSVFPGTIYLMPETRPGALYPTDEELQASASNPGETYGLPVGP